jgi:hypothetical protein
MSTLQEVSTTENKLGDENIVSFEEKYIKIRI